jgi:hypothetical protein
MKFTKKSDLASKRQTGGRGFVILCHAPQLLFGADTNLKIRKGGETASLDKRCNYSPSIRRKSNSFQPGLYPSGYEAPDYAVKNGIQVSRG